MNIEERLDRLERHNRNLCRGLVGLLLVAVPLITFSCHDKKPKVTDAHLVAKEITVDRLNVKYIDVSSYLAVHHPGSEYGIHAVALQHAGASLTLSSGKGPGGFIELLVRDGFMQVLAANKYGSVHIDGMSQGAPECQITKHRDEDVATINETGIRLYREGKFRAALEINSPVSRLTLLNDKGIVVQQVPK